MRRGFTLVELLIAITIIGVLASGLLLSGGSATASARALTIVTDLRVLKEAVLMLYIDSMDVFEAKDGDTVFKGLNPSGALARYIDNPKKYEDTCHFDAANGRWYVYCDITGASAKDVQANLTGRAKSAGLLGGADPNRAYSGGPSVYMLVR